MTPRRPLFFAALAVFALELTACGASHINEYEPKRRDYKMPVELSEAESERQEGSLWSESSQANILFADQRAMRLGDIVTVRVEEFANASRDAKTELRREAQLNAEIQQFLGALAALQAANPALGTLAIDGSSAKTFNGTGTSGRTENVRATVPAVVRQVLPNGNIFVEGHRVVLVNNEEHHFYVSGVARPQDINQANAISSSKLADAEVEFTGRGVLTDNQREGWLSRWFSWAWPF